MKKTAVLVVEDEMIIAFDLSHRLERMGYEVRGPVPSGEEALESIRARPPDLVLMDIMLDGEMDGIAAAKQVREEFNIPVVYLTSNSDPVTVERAQATRPFSYLLKPVRERELRMSIEMAVLHHATARQLRVANEELAVDLGRRDADLCDEVRERVLVERDLRRTREAAQTARAAMGRVLSAVSAELRTPMNEIVSSVGILECAPLETRYQQSLRSVKTAAGELVMSVGNVLDLMELHYGRVQLKAELFELRPCVETAMAYWRERARAKGLEFVCDISPTLPVALHGDSARLTQLLDALVDNALKFTDEGGVEVGLTVLERRGGRLGLQLLVRDTGIGISQEKQRAIFETFSPVEEPPDRRLGGVGTGLAIAAHIVDLMDGSIWLASAPGSGCAFRCALWFQERAEEKPAASGASRHACTVAQ